MDSVFAFVMWLDPIFICILFIGESIKSESSARACCTHEKEIESERVVDHHIEVFVQTKQKGFSGVALAIKFMI